MNENNLTAQSFATKCNISFNDLYLTINNLYQYKVTNESPIPKHLHLEIIKELCKKHIITKLMKSKILKGINKKKKKLVFANFLGNYLVEKTQLTHDPITQSKNPFPKRNSHVISVPMGGKVSKFK